MKNLAAAVVVLAALSATAHAFELKPSEATVVSVGPVSGEAYFDQRGSQLYLIATLAQKDSLPIRVVTMMSPEERLTVTVPGIDGAAPQQVAFLRRGDTVVVYDAALTTAGAN